MEHYDFLLLLLASHGASDHQVLDILPALRCTLVIPEAVYIRPQVNTSIALAKLQDVLSDCTAASTSDSIKVILASIRWSLAHS